MTNNKLQVNELKDCIRTYLPEKLSVNALHITVWKAQLDCKIAMLKRKGYSDKFIDRFVDRSIELFASELIKEREA